MGNQLIKNVDLEKEINCQAGHNSLWSIYSGTKQDVSKTKVSVFTVDKTKWETKKNKQQSDDLTNFVKREYQNLVKYKHPYILGIVESLVESPKAMAFATENIKTSLFQAYSDNSYNIVYPSELQFKVAILDLCEAIKFFHGTLNQPFLSLYPENIYITQSDKWKLGAPLFSQPNQSDLNIEFNSVQSIPLHPNLSFTAPEVLQKKNMKQSDIFSLGLLICSILKSKHDQSCYHNKMFTASDLAEHQMQISSVNSSISNQQFWKLINNNEFKQLVLKMVDLNPSKRPPIEVIMQNNYLNDQFVQILKHLDNFYSFEPDIQSKFLKELEKAVLHFSKSLVCSQILPKLMLHFQNDKLMPLILQIIIQVIQHNLLDSTDFQEIVWKNHLRNIQSLREVPAQSLYLIVDKIDLLLDMVDKIEIQNQIMPLFMKCYDCSISKLQIKAIQSTISLFSRLDPTFIRTKVFPKLLQLCLSNIQDLRLQALHTIHHILDHLDTTTNQELLKVLLKAFQNSSSQVRMLILSVYQKMAESIELVQINENILPSLIIKLTDFSLSKQEFELYYKSVQQMINKIYNKRIQDDHFQQAQGEYDVQTIIRQLDQQLQQSSSGIVQQQSFSFDFMSIGGNSLSQFNQSGQQNSNQSGQQNSNQSGQLNSNQSGQLNDIQFDNMNGVSFNNNPVNTTQQNNNNNSDFINNAFDNQMNNNNNTFNSQNKQQNKSKNLNLKFNRNNESSNQIQNKQNTINMNNNNQMNNNPFENNILSNQNSQNQNNVNNVNWNLEQQILQIKDRNDDFFSGFNVQNNNKQQNKTLNIQKNGWNQDDDLI